MIVTPTPPSACSTRWVLIIRRCSSIRATGRSMRIEPDVVSAWSASPDGLTYMFKLRQDVRFHDGSSMTSADVKASYDRIINPPEGVLSSRRALYEDI